MIPEADIIDSLSETDSIERTPHPRAVLNDILHDFLKILPNVGVADEAAQPIHSLKICQKRIRKRKNYTITRIILTRQALRALNQSSLPNSHLIVSSDWNLFTKGFSMNGFAWKLKQLRFMFDNPIEDSMGQWVESLEVNADEDHYYLIKGLVSLALMS
ncbi:hypothetical protein ACH5RR_026141 [Cinchona calisaya]|uniref:Uncharacterized protein n=1 Tax=Cinchona calisaya TaxID=153742 RepID=A0ABD2Z2S8_9GENT